VPACLSAILPALCRLLVSLAALQVAGGSAAAADLLTVDERSWLDAHAQPLRRGADPGWPPFEFRDEAGLYAGMCQDYSDLVAARLGIAIEVVPDLDWKTILERLRGGELDVISCLVKTPERSAFMAFSKPYTTIPAVIYTRNDSPYVGRLRDLRGRRVTTIRGYAITEFLKKEHAGLELVECDTPLECLQSVAVGQADAFVGSLVVGVYHVRKYNLANLKVAAPAEVPPLELRFGIRKDWQPLAVMIDKALATISPEEHTVIQQRWVTVEYDPVIDYSLVWKVSGALSLLLLLAVTWIYQVRRQKQALQRSKSRLIRQRDELEKLTRDLEAYGERVARELEMARETQTVLLPDTQTVQEIYKRHGLHVDFRFQPSSELGGDFWGLRSLDASRVAVMAVDFSGHGINAALNTFRLHALLDSDRQHVDDPAAFLQHLNRRISPLLPPGQYATMFYGVIDSNSDLITYAGAATPSPLVFLPGQGEPLVGSGVGFPIGMFDESTYENHELPFPIGASLLLYSDAVTEGKMKNGGRLEEAGLIQVVIDCLADAPRGNLVQALTARLDRLLELPLADDLTIVSTTRMTPPGATATPSAGQRGAG
jgi:serine phosphatase RsbU (regulator of sigma subunit)/ABC-type amino acid transport substrate-binding protein